MQSKINLRVKLSPLSCRQKFDSRKIFRVGLSTEYPRRSPSDTPVMALVQQNCPEIVFEFGSRRPLLVPNLSHLLLMAVGGEDG